MRITDNSWTNTEAFASIPAITGMVADKTLAQLEKEGFFVFPGILRKAEDITGDQKILESMNGQYHAGNVMGFLSCGSESLVIESRFGKENKDYFFWYMLQKVFKLPNLTSLDADASFDRQFFQILMILFPAHLRAALRKGVFKTYCCRKYNDSNIKGTVNLPRHIRKNTPFVGKIAYNQREYSYDNALMELVRHTVEFMRQKPYGKTILSQVKDEVKQVVAATPSYRLGDRKKVLAANLKSPVRHGYYREYRALQQLCIWILQYQSCKIGVGSRRVNGILFDGAWLWEEYVNTLLSDALYHPMNKSGKESQWLFDGNQGKIFPDFISHNSDARIIADAKYKPWKNIDGRDYLQVLAYMFRFEAKCGFYLYPEDDHSAEKTLWLNRGSTYENDPQRRGDICVIKLGLQIPTETDCYDSFVAKIQENEHIFKQKILEKTAAPYAGPAKR